MTDSRKVLFGDTSQGAPLRKNNKKHILDSSPDVIEAVLALPQTHKAEKKIDPLRK
jgi:hypothetical protein